MTEMVRDAGRIDEDALPVHSSLEQQTVSLTAHGADEEENQSSPGANQPNEKEQELAKLAEQIEALAVPGYVVTTEGVFTTVTRTRKLAQRDSYLTQIARWLLRSHKWLPLLYRFMKDSCSLAPWRMCLLVVDKLLKSVTPAVKLWATTKLLGIVETAVATGYVNRSGLCIYAVITGLTGTGIRKFDRYLVWNTGVLERKYGAMIVSRILKTIAILDWPAWSDPTNNALIYEASKLVQGSSSQAFKILTDMIRVFTISAGAVAQMAFLRRALTSENGDLFAIGLFANVLHSINWLVEEDSAVTWAVTSKAYQRMKHIWNDSLTEPESVLLGLPQHFHQEFDKANESLGDIPTSKNGSISKISQAARAIHDFSTPLIYSLFAVRAASKRSAAGANSPWFQAAYSTSVLYTIESAIWALADNVHNLFHVLEEVRNHMTDVQQFYKALDIQPKMKCPTSPEPYTSKIIEDSDGGKRLQGMQIQFRDVNFRYPASNRNALSDVTFDIAPGSLVCVVGYNGAGKSTLINLLTRLADPTSGTVLINGVDAKQYAPQDLYAHISCQFQETCPLKCTIREWLHQGDLGGDDDEEKMRECLRLAEAYPIIAKFPKGLDARLGPYPADATPQSLLMQMVHADYELERESPTDQTQLDAAKQAETEEWHEEGPDDRGDDAGVHISPAGRDCTFSPGEWSKMCFARTLMKVSADLRIFDEPTAKMDPIASRAVFDKIESFRGTCTIVHITHDLSACLNADQVILFENGTNVETGTHAELLTRLDSRYRQFYMASIGQEAGTNWQEEGLLPELHYQHSTNEDVPQGDIELGDTTMERLEESAAKVLLESAQDPPMKTDLARLKKANLQQKVEPATELNEKTLSEDSEADEDSGYDGSSTASSCSDLSCSDL